MPAQVTNVPCLDPQQISDLVFRMKYAAPGETTYQDLVSRLVRFFARKAPKMADAYGAVLSGKEFLPAGRILANAGTDRKNTTFCNCFVLPPVPDSLDGIFNSVHDAALTQKAGGGVGLDFSLLRPAGQKVTTIGADASGPVSFMHVFDSACKTIQSAGQRRGAQMAVLRVDHPDILQFVRAKRGTDGRSGLTMFNLSVGITDAFMNSVKLESKPESDIWAEIVDNAWQFAEPGLLFLDTINNQNNLRYNETITACNPCGEAPLPPNGACLLGSICLPAFVRDAAWDLVQLDRTVRLAVQMLDICIDECWFPLKAQRVEARHKRRIGIGVTGLADALMAMGQLYGTPASLAVIGEVMETIRNAAYGESAKLAVEHGAFPELDVDHYTKSPFIQLLPSSIRKDISTHGIRNSHLLSVAPTGTMSLLLGNVSSGIEPVFGYRPIRTLLVDGKPTKFELGANTDQYANSSVWVSSDQVSWEQHLAVQVKVQRSVDQAVSKTLNLPADTPRSTVGQIFMKAWTAGLKGVTVYRPSNQLAAVLETKKTTETEAPQAQAPVIIQSRKRPATLYGRTVKLLAGEQRLYLTINTIRDDNGKERLFEVFANCKDPAAAYHLAAVTRLLSAVFRTEENPRFVLEELKGLLDPEGGYFADQRRYPSMLAHVGYVLETVLDELDGVKKEEKERPVRTGKFCSKCSTPSLEPHGDCWVCSNCGYEKCG